MTTTDFSLDGRRITILDASHGEAAPLIYMHFAVDEAETVLKTLDMPLIIAAAQSLFHSCLHKRALRRLHRQ